MPLVDDDGIFLAVLVAQQFAEDGAEAGAVHGLHMYIGNAPAGELLDHLAVAVNPSFVE